MNDIGDRHSTSPSPSPHDAGGKEQFIHPQSRYRGEFTPGRLAFNSNLQEFAQRVSIICNLETNGKMEPEAAYGQIKELWQQLQQSKHEFLDEEEQTPS